MWKRWCTQALGLLTLSACPVCGRAAGRYGLALLCAQCRPCWRGQPCCQTCGQWLAPTPMLQGRQPHRCRDCRGLRLYYDQAQSLGPYRASWRQAVLAFKNRPAGELAFHLGALCIRFLHDRSIPGPGTRMVPVPHRPGRTPHAAYQLAKKVSGRLSLPFCPELSFQHRTAPQHTLKRKLRLKNMQGSMIWKGGALAGASCLVIDDVYTTGATVNECARVLKGHGAGRIDVLTLARSGRKMSESSAGHIAVV